MITEKIDKILETLANGINDYLCFKRGLKSLGIEYVDTLKTNCKPPGRYDVTTHTVYPTEWSISYMEEN